MADTQTAIDSNCDEFTYVDVLRILLAAAFIVASVFARKIVVDLLVKGLEASGWDKDHQEKAKHILAGPISLLCVMSGVFIGSIVADLPQELEFLVALSQKSFIHVIIFYVVYHSISPISELLKTTSTGSLGVMGNELREIGVKFTKVLICAIGLLVVLQTWGVNVSAFLAGLGLAGMAVALAAGDTMKNFFGTIVVLADNIFHANDWIKSAQVEGIVEHFGLRTTFIRGFDTSQITIPNSTLANTSIVNFGRCTERQVCWTLPVVAPNNESFEQVVDAWRNHLKENPDVSKKRLIIVQLDQFGCACIEVFVLFFTNETGWLKYMEQKEKIILEFNRIIGQHGCKFGIPTAAIVLNSA